MRAPKTVVIGIAVALLGLVQFATSGELFRLVTVTVGLALVGFGWGIGWTRYRGFTVALGHGVLVVGCLVTAYAAYQLPFLAHPPTVLEVLDLPLFWGLFTACGGVCMITHGSCACCIRQHELRNQLRAQSPRELGGSA
jgi:hypothetical protein